MKNTLLIKLGLPTLILLHVLLVFGYAESPFAVDAQFDAAMESLTVSVDVSVPSGYFIYADQFSVENPEGQTLDPLAVPEPVMVRDPFSDEEKAVYDKDVVARYAVSEKESGRVKILVKFQGCSESVCFFPEEHVFEWGAGEAADAPTSGSSEVGSDWRAAAARFRVVGKASGDMTVDAFLAFLEGGQGAQPTEEASSFTGLGMWSALLAILLGGIALNLTPCVLPMIPINLAIIGAGAQAGSRLRGLAMGGAYGLAIALTYGVLGVVVVLTGATFGTLNSSPWFNFAMAVIFVVLALAMFDVIHIDFSRFQGRVGGAGKPQKTGFFAAFSMGTVAALLAGACVAPVVIGVLVWAQDLFTKGVTLGLALPFVLGLGMGLPWPIAGAGLSFLPKPGKWMAWVKSAFGVFILVLALYYGYLGYKGLSVPEQDLAVQLEQAHAEGRSVFLDFWATWCKNCHAMEEGTFKDKDVQAALSSYSVIKYQAEAPNKGEAKDVLEYFDALGLPTYIILEPLP